MYLFPSFFMMTVLLPVDYNDDLYDSLLADNINPDNDY